MVYSPLGVEAYRLDGITPDYIDNILSYTHSEPIWNLFWMSHPDLDLVPAAGPSWWKVYRPRLGALAAVITDVTDDLVLKQKLMSGPGQFAEWFQKEDHSIYDAYYVLGEDKWVSTVLARADEAARRLLSQAPVVSGNVYKVDFRKRRA